MGIIYWVAFCLVVFSFHLGSLGLGLLWVHICLLAAFYSLLPSFFQGVFTSSVSLLMNKLG